jgi:hypothetical protein
MCVLCTFGIVFGDYDWESNPGNGTEGSPYQISTAEQLASIGSNAVILDKYFILTADINMSAYTFDNSPIAPDTDQSSNSYTGENKFTGSLDGKYHCIKNLTITRSGTSYNIGLIGLPTGNWEIKNLGLENINITVGDSSDYLGGLVSRGYGGTILACYVTGSITSGNSTRYMGGLAGFASTTNISNCYVMCTVTNGTESSRTGGAVGYLALSTGRLEKCYSTSVVDSKSTASTIGALVGILFNGAQANDCYYLSSAGPNNGIGNPRNATQLKLITNYTNWEFNGAKLGNQGYWRMRADQPDYPYLAWEFVKGDFYGDFQVDYLDFAAFSQSWERNPDSFDFNWLCDLNNNFVIDISDFRSFSDDWLIVY